MVVLIGVTCVGSGRSGYRSW